MPLEQLNHATHSGHRKKTFIHLNHAAPVGEIDALRQVANERTRGAAQHHAGIGLELVKVAVRDLDKPRSFPGEYATTDLLRASVYKKSFAVDGFNSASFEVTLVPEPQTWALLIAGLGFVGFKARRRG